MSLNLADMGDIDESENEPLLKEKSKQENEENKDNNGRKFPYHLIAFVVVLFACAEDLQSKVVTLYLYEVLEQGNGNNSDTGSNRTVSSQCEPSNKSSTSENAVQAEASHWTLYFSLLEKGITLILMFIIGLYSDVVGRKPFMLLSLIGTGVKFVVTAVIVYKRYQIPFLLIIYSIGGIAGGYSIFAICCLAIIADVTHRSKSRTLGLALFDVLIGVGLSGTEIASGYLVQKTGYIWPCVISASLCVVCSLIYIFFIPETAKLTPSQRHDIKTTLTDLVKFYYSDKHFYEETIWPFNLSMTIFVIIWFAYGASISTLYELGSPFCWTPEDIGWYSSVTIVSHLIIGVALIRVFQFCFQDESIAVIGCISSMIYYFIFGIANTSWMLYVASVSGIMSITTLPILRSIMSKMVKEDKQGALFANVCIVETVCSLLSSTLFNNIYAATQYFWRGFAFIIQAGLYLICILMFIPLIVYNRRQRRKQVTYDVIDPTVQ